MSSDFKSTYIRDLKISNGMVLAPMSGVTCMSFRRLVKELNGDAVGLLISEFISVEGMTRKARKTLEMMKFHESERPFGIQIFGFDIQRMSDAAKMCQDVGVDLVDINCGCPAPKVVRKGGGCELMRQPEHLSKLFGEVRRAVTVPLTMKMRSGWDETSMNCDEIAHIAESEGLEAVTIHGRTRAQLYRGDADWSHPSRVKSKSKIPVFGSGDVVNQYSAKERIKTGVDGLFIGRGAISNPMVFRDILDGKENSIREDPIKAISVINRYAELLSEECSKVAATGKLKQLVSQLVRGQEWRRRFLTTTDYDTLMEILRESEEKLQYDS